MLLTHFGSQIKKEHEGIGAAVNENAVLIHDHQAFEENFSWHLAVDSGLLPAILESDCIEETTRRTGHSSLKGVLFVPCEANRMG
ncbi:hypothetical protein EZV62_015397 [Acer yangbiense]|uniref:Uncharacterized protein n=1 Tax=Acer yangbiense TaxID=1000413 RepID=A0A5C7HL23_9ROSI|nr:hypothetical protein EZV62_015397 [Acer yangbiense]